MGGGGSPLCPPPLLPATFPSASSSPGVAGGHRQPRGGGLGGSRWPPGRVLVLSSGAAQLAVGRDRGWRGRRRGSRGDPPDPTHTRVCCTHGGKLPLLQGTEGAHSPPLFPAPPQKKKSPQMSPSHPPPHHPQPCATPPPQLPDAVRHSPATARWDPPVLVGHPPPPPQMSPVPPVPQPRTGHGTGTRVSPPPPPAPSPGEVRWGQTRDTRMETRRVTAGASAGGRWVAPPPPQPPPEGTVTLLSPLLSPPWGT